MSIKETDNRDYKYIMQDISHIYLGAKYSYEELLCEDDIPFKIKKLIHSYVESEVKEEDLTIESHFYYMNGSGFLYQTFLQLKTSVKFSTFSESKGHFVTEIMKLQDFVKMSPEEKESKSVLIQEIIISKLALLSI